MLQWFKDRKTAMINHLISLPSLLIILSIFFLLWLNGAWVTKKSKLPPSPPRLPLIGHLHCLGSLPHRSLRALSQKYGSLMLLHLGFTPTLVVSSAEMGREIMKTHDVIFSDRPKTKGAKEFVYGGKNVGFAPYGEYWRQVKKICVTDLLSVKRVQSFRYVRDEEITDMVKNIKELCLLGMDVKIGDLVTGVSNNIISRAAFGKRLEGRERTEVVKELIDQMGAFSFEDFFPSLGWIDGLTGLTSRMKKTARSFHSLLDEVIEEHTKSRKTDAQDDKKDMVDLLLEAESEPSLGIKFTRESHRAVLMDMLTGGTESTGSTLEWVMAELLTHPNVMNKLQEGVRQVVGEKGKIDEDNISEMEYLKCVIKESLRLHPPTVLSLPRLSTKPIDIEGYHIPAKTKVFINLWAICRDPVVWDRPDEFIPERFANNPVDYRGAHFEFIPFGAGRRICPGISFSIAAVESILANLIYWFDWEMTGGAKKMEIDKTEKSGISVHMKNPLVLVPRSHFA